jgi:hypothetical protein
MTPEYELIDALSFALYAWILYFLSVLSKRIGQAMAMKKYYYLYYIGIFLTLCASIIMFLSLDEYQDSFRYGYIFFAAGLSCGLIATIRYWGWIIKEILKG